jgi:hypothetical protein
MKKNQDFEGQNLAEQVTQGVISVFGVRPPHSVALPFFFLRRIHCKFEVAIEKKSC